jgi:hypothetical protein
MPSELAGSWQGSKGLGGINRHFKILPATTMVLDRILPERWFRYPGLEIDTAMCSRLAEDDFLFSHRNLHVFAAAVQDRKRDQEAVVLDRILPERWFRYPGLEIDTLLRLRLAEAEFLF